MKNLNKRIIWGLLLFMAWLVLGLNKSRNKQMYINFINELKELCKKNSKYLEDGDYIMIRREELKRKKHE